MAPKIGEDEARFWDLMLKAIGGAIALITVAVGCQTLRRQGDQLKIQQKQLSNQQSQFETTSKEQVKALEEEYHRRFWEKKLEVYIQLCHTAGVLELADPKSDEYQQALHQLRMIYGGELQLLASSNVKTALGNFLNALLSTNPTPGMAELADRVKKGERIIIMDLRRAVANLALECRQDSGSEFHLNDQEVTKYKADAEYLMDNWEKLLPSGVTRREK
jgi:hypothetical protein